MSTRVAERFQAGPSVSAGRPLRRSEVALEAVVGNRLGARMYERWAESLELAGDERVLEIGTGAGACARHLAARLPSGSLTCLDIDARWLARARRRLARFGARVSFVEADAAEWAQPGAFDVVIAHFVLHDLTAPQRQRSLSRIAESLALHGRLCLREPVNHGMTAPELHSQLRDAGFTSMRDPVRERLPLMGEATSEMWRRRFRDADGAPAGSTSAPPLPCSDREGSCEGDSE